MAIQTSPVNVEERRQFDIRPGDTVRVYQKVVEKGKTRHQPFEGTVIARKHGSEAGATFTVRRVSSGVGVERIFPLYSPNIDKIEVLRRARVRRAKLYYIRTKVTREIRRQMRRMQFMDQATESEADRAQRLQQEQEAKEAAEAEAQEQSHEGDEQQEQQATDTGETQQEASQEEAPTTGEESDAAASEESEDTSKQS